MNVLGVSAFGDASGAGLVRDGRAIALAPEAHFSRRPGETGIPRRAVRFCLAQGELNARDIDAWVFYERPLRRFERVLARQLADFPRSSKTFGRELFSWLGERMWIKSQLASEFGIDPARIAFTDHHVAHAAGAFFLSPFEEAAILTVDGAGEWATTSLAHGRGATVEIQSEIHHPHSLGLASRAVAQFLGFPAPGDATKIGALAAHGEARFADDVRRFVRVDADGHFALDPRAFISDLDGGLACGRAWIDRFGEPRRPTDPLRYQGDDRHHADVAASYQAVLEDALLALARELHRRIPTPNLCLSGEVVENAAAVARVCAEGPFSEVFLPPDCGDTGAALGAALYAHSVRVAGLRPIALTDPWLGEPVLREPRADGHDVQNEEARIERMVDALVDGRTVGWVRGRAECGPTASGRRVLLADPRQVAMSARVSQGITRRESFLPYSPVLPAERADEFFEMPASARRPARARQVVLRGNEAARRVAPAALHVDGRACPLLVDRAHDAAFHRLLTRFGERTGAPLVLCTSLALRGERPARGEADALALFERSALDVLVVEERVYSRS